MMNYRTLLLDNRDGIVTLTINRPEKLNALNAEAKKELRGAIESLGNDSTVSVVILTGAGDKAFVAGTDIEELAGLERESGRAFAAGGQELFDRIEHFPKPVIAAVNGYALGGGNELALACHLRVASDRARFGQPEVNLGIIPGYGGTQRLARLVGRGRALEMILTGEHIDAAEALRIGLVNRVVPHAELHAVVTAVAKTIAGKGPEAVRLALEAVRAVEELGLADGLRKEAELFGSCCATEDFREGTRAFLDKRKPVFVGR
jgi:enoyl-CoA hydratase